MFIGKLYRNKRHFKNGNVKNHKNHYLKVIMLTKIKNKFFISLEVNEDLQECKIFIQERKSLIFAKTVNF